MNITQQQYRANWHDSFVGYISQCETLITALIASSETTDEDKRVLERMRLMLHGKDTKDIEKDLSDCTISKSTLDKIERLNKDLTDTAVEQLKTDAVVKVYLKRLTHLKLEQDKKVEELRLRALNINI